MLGESQRYTWEVFTVKLRNASRIWGSSLRRGYADLSIVPILVYVLLKPAQICVIFFF